jgi:biotin carboxyl carrier protein
MQRKFRLTVDGRQHDITVEELTYSSSVPYLTRDTHYIPSSPSKAPASHSTVGSRAIRRGSAEADEVICTLGGMVESVLVTPDQQISAGDKLIVIEAMKMKTPIAAPRAGKVGSILVKTGESVETGQVLVRITAA